MAHGTKRFIVIFSLALLNCDLKKLVSLALPLFLFETCVRAQLMASSK